MTNSLLSHFKKILLHIARPERKKYLGYGTTLLFVCGAILFYFSISVFSVLMVFLLILAYEAAFRLVYQAYHGKQLPERFPISPADIPLEEHPYLPWVYKKNYTPPTGKKIYSDERQEFMVGGVKTNNLRHVNGEDGGRDVIIPKPKNLYRIVCLGDSTTCNYVKTNNNQLLSWPLALESKLKKLNPRIEVNNCGQGGYNTNEVVIKFLIDTIDTAPDLVIFYHAFVNVRGYLTDGFERDFFHFRRTMDSSYPLRVRIARYIPTFGMWSLRYLVGEYLTYFNLKEDHVRMINRNNDINREKEPEGLEIFERNLENLVHVCKGRGINLVLSTYCYYLYDKIKDSAIHIKFYDTVQKENQIIREIASKHSLMLVDTQKMMKYDEDHFIDEVHPTALGMESMATNFYNSIKDCV